MTNNQLNAPSSLTADSDQSDDALEVRFADQFPLKAQNRNCDDHPQIRGQSRAGLRSVYSGRSSIGDAPGPICQLCPRSVPTNTHPLPHKKTPSSRMLGRQYQYNKQLTKNTHVPLSKFYP